MLSLFSLVTPLVLLTSAPLSSATPTSPLGALVSDVVGGVITTVVSPVLDLLADPPPTFIQTLTPSPQCATSVGGNGGELLCCIASVAGDNQIIEFVAKLYGYNLNPNDVNGLDCYTNSTCPGVPLCCQVTFATPLLALWCQSPPGSV